MHVIIAKLIELPYSLAVRSLASANLGFIKLKLFCFLGYASGLFPEGKNNATMKPSSVT